MAGADRLVRLGLDAGRHADEHAPHARGGRALRLVERVEDDERARLGGRAQLLVGLVVAVDERAARRRSRRAGRRRARRASTTSAPSPSSASSRITATFGNAFVP